MKKFLLAGMFVLMLSLVPIGVVSTGCAYADTETTFTQQVYTYTDEDGNYTITLTSENEYTMTASADETEATLKGRYVLSENKLTLYALNEVFGVMEIQEGNALVRLDSTAVESNETSVSNYFREKIMPYILANVSSIFTAFLTILFTLGKMRSATAELKTANFENTFLRKKVKQLETDIDYLKTELASVKKTTQNTKEMVKIGFCNTSELVENGFAEEIAKVGANEETSES